MTKDSRSVCKRKELGVLGLDIVYIQNTKGS